MRQQYHTRLVNGRQHVWDVNKLTVLAAGLPVIDVPLRDLKELDECGWFDEVSKEKPTARQIALHAMLISQCDLSYPIILNADGRVMDGLHRCCRALIEGHETIKAVKFKQTPVPDFVDPDIDGLPYNDNFGEVLERFGLGG